VRRTPRAHEIGVGQRFLCRERLGDDDQQCALGIEPVDSVSDIRAVDVRGKANIQTFAAMWLQRIDQQAWPQIGAADAEMNDRVDIAPDRACKRRHLLAHSRDLRAWQTRAQRPMHSGTMFGRINFLAREHFGAPSVEVSGVGGLVKGGKRCAINPLLGEVRDQMWRFERQLLHALRIGGE